MNKDIFPKEWLEAFEVVFGSESISILDKIDDDPVFLIDILCGKLDQYNKLLELESVSKMFGENKQLEVAGIYYNKLLLSQLIEDAENLLKMPHRQL